MATRGALLGLALLGFVVGGASLHHLHASSEVGLWNEEHDLGLMAALGTAVFQVDAMPVLGLALVLLLVLAPASGDAAGAPLRLSGPRAPPLG